MKIKLYIFLAIILAIVLSAIYPLINHYTNKEILPIPVHHTYQDAVMDILSDSICAKAERNNCENNILPIDKVQGKSNFYPSLKEDINLALASYTGWQLRASKKEIEDMRKRFDETSELWGEIMGFDEMVRSMKRQAEVIHQTDYSVYAELFELSEKRKNNQKLVININDEKSQILSFKVEVSFVHPKTLQKWQNEQAKQKAQLNTLKKRADLSIYLLEIFCGLLLLYILFLSGNYFYKKYINKKHAEYFLIEIQKRQQLADNGHFVAALQLAEKYLQLFPDDSDVIAFKERLLDFTNNDPKKAQIAFVEAKKLQLRVNMAKDDPMQAFLSPDEKKRLTPYLPYYPQLKKSYLALVSGEEKAEKQEEFQIQLKNLKELLSEGKLTEAESTLNKIEIDNKNNIELEDVRNEIQHKKEKAKKDWEQIQQNLIKGEIINVREGLKEILHSFQDMPEALSLQQDIIQSKGKTCFYLNPQNQEKEIYIYCGNKFSLGRKDEDNFPDIIFNDKYISREHASVFINDNNVFIEDLNSTGGTYINGKKISRQPLKNGDLITLAKIIDFKVSVFFTKEGNLGGLILSGISVDYIIVFSYIQMDLKNEKLCFTNNKFSIYYKDNITIFANQKAGCLLKEGQEILLNNNKYIVEVTNEKNAT